MVTSRSGEYNEPPKPPDLRRRPTNANDGEENSSAGVEKVNTICENLAHSVLRSVDSKTVALFLRERKRYIQRGD